MLKKNILNLILFIFVITLTLIIYFSEEKNITLDKLSETNLNNIHSITIQHNKNTTKLFRTTGGHWKITHPVSIAANEFRISSILKLLNAPVHNKYASNEIDLKKIGLDKPATSIKLNDEKITFGIINPATDLRYIQKGNLLPANSEIIKLILLNQTISKNEKGLWQSNIAISADNINKTLEHWQQDQAFGVHEYMQRDSLGDIFVYLKDQPPITYLITDTDPWLILARPELGLEYHLDIKAYKNIITPK